MSDDDDFYVSGADEEDGGGGDEEQTEADGGADPMDVDGGDQEEGEDGEGDEAAEGNEDTGKTKTPASGTPSAMKPATSLPAEKTAGIDFRAGFKAMVLRACICHASVNGCGRKPRQKAKHTGGLDFMTTSFKKLALCNSLPCTPDDNSLHVVAPQTTIFKLCERGTKFAVFDAGMLAMLRFFL